MKLYELVGRDPEKGFSPFAWRIKMALAHKGLNYESVPLHFTEIKETLTFADSKTVPVLIDGENSISDSWNIACYLEEHYSESSSLFDGEKGKAAAQLMGHQVARPLLMPLFRVLVSDIYNVIDECDKDYFRETREPRIGCTIEEAAKDYDQALKTFQTNLLPYQDYFNQNDFLCGQSAAYSDYILYGMFLWARATSGKRLIEDDSSVNLWIKRMDGLFNGLGGSVSLIK